MPSALAEIAEFMASTISATLESCDPVHCQSQARKLDASVAPYCVGTKKALVVTWLTKTNFHRGVSANGPAPPPSPPPPSPSPSSPPHAAARSGMEASAVPSALRAMSWRRLRPRPSPVGREARPFSSTLTPFLRLPRDRPRRPHPSGAAI